MAGRTVRIGSCSGFWGDSADGARQLVEQGRIDYLVGDYLAEITMSLLARARQRDASRGYTPDFIDALAPLLPQIAQQGIKVVVNAGGLNPDGCRAALAAAADAAGVQLKIAVVEGDDLMPRLEEVRAAAPAEMFSGAPFPGEPVSMNAYLGARPIAAALAMGAQVVITGRCVDSALVLGPLIHEFGWGENDFDLLSAGSLAGHLIECGAQCTGGLFTDWEDVPGWEDMGFPIAECRPDGTIVVCKPEGAGGLVTPACVAEQMLYEIGDPAAYLLPDVTCDWRQVRFEQAGQDRVRVSGATGSAPPDTYKVCATYSDGFRSQGTLMIAGFDAVRKARRQGEAILARARRLMARAGFPDFSETSIEVLGAEDTYGANARAANAREVVLKVAVTHRQAGALGVFSREFVTCGTSMAQGSTGFAGGRPAVTPVVRLHSFLWPKAEVRSWVHMEGTTEPVGVHPGAPFSSRSAPAVAAEWAPAEGEPAPLRRIAWGRSGDKGDSANIGLIARRPEYAQLIRDQVTPERVADYFRHLVHGDVLRFELPGCDGFNFVMTRALGGGGMASLRYDPQGKALAAMLLDMPVMLPVSLSRAA